MPTPRSLSAIDSDSDSSYSEPSVLEISSGEEDEPSGDPNVIEVSSDEDGNMQASASAASNNVFQADGEAVPGSKANPISVATPSPVKKHPKRPRGRPDSPESPSPLPSRKNRRVEDAAAADARALRILEGNMRVDTNPASLLAMARAGLQALKATKLVLPDPRMVPIPRARPGQAATEPVEFLSVAQERQMLEWEGYQVLRTAFVGAALDVLKGLDPDAPYVVVRRRYTLYVDPFQKPPHPLRVDPAHRCCSCNSLASHPVFIFIDPSLGSGATICFVLFLGLSQGRLWRQTAPSAVASDGVGGGDQTGGVFVVKYPVIARELMDVCCHLPLSVVLNKSYGVLRAAMNMLPRYLAVEYDATSTATTRTTTTRTAATRKPATESQLRAAKRYRERHRARLADNESLAAEAQERAREASAAYRRRHAQEVATRAKEKRERLWARKHGAEAYVARLVAERSHS
ncbi:hypothetical protein C8F01DRAFT_1092982 [Mycena amicta]|nr:hypothetical protein C8F01DRAFT_1092982 [Mycena amicta]